MKAIVFVATLSMALAQEIRVLPAVKLAGAGAFAGQGQQQNFPLQQSTEGFEADLGTNVQQQEEVHQEFNPAFPPSGVFEPYNLPAGASLLLGNIDTSFECRDNPYGYYGDERNYCAIFHVCLPYRFSDGRIETIQYSFMCGEGTVFDQKKFACVEQSAATPCQDTPTFFARNEEFGLPEEKF